MEDESDFHAFFDAGRRSPSDMLPDYDAIPFLAWQLADGDPVRFDYLMEKTYSELRLLYGYKRTQLYLALQKNDDDDEPR